MDILAIKDYLLTFLFEEFDHDLINDQSNDPFLHLSLITSSEINPHRDSFGFYLKRRDRVATHTAFTTANMATALVLEGKYLLQKPSKAQPIEDTIGCTVGIKVGKNQIMIVTAITLDPEDAKFVCRIITNKILAFSAK